MTLAVNINTFNSIVICKTADSQQYVIQPLTF